MVAAFLAFGVGPFGAFATVDPIALWPGRAVEIRFFLGFDPLHLCRRSGRCLAVLGMDGMDGREKGQSGGNNKSKGCFHDGYG